jgi:hypothetical protein
LKYLPETFQLLKDVRVRLGFWTTMLLVSVPRVLLLTLRAAPFQDTVETVLGATISMLVVPLRSPVFENWSSNSSRRERAAYQK